MGGRHKLVSDLLVDLKVPAWWRDQVPLLVRGDGEIMWVCGCREDERAKVRDETSQVTVVRLRKV
jgi:tRNA(Ile)-lysidine synthase